MGLINLSRWAASWRFVVLTTAVIGCHNEPPCEASMGPGAHLTVELLEELPSPTAPRCDSISLKAGDTFTVTTGEPTSLGAEGVCLVTAADGPPEFEADFEIRSCAPLPGIGTSCVVQRPGCPDSGGLSIKLVGDDRFAVGQAREMTYKVRLTIVGKPCPSVGCSLAFRASVTRID